MSEWRLSSFHRKRYSDWAGRPAGNPPKPEQCCENVWPSGRFPIPHQCHRARGFGPEKAYCKQHDPDYVTAKRKAASDRENVKLQKERIEWAAHDLFAALCQIADGHNDPRAVAVEAIKGLTRPNTLGHRGQANGTD